VNSNKRAAQSKVVKMMVSDVGQTREENTRELRRSGFIGPLSDPDTTVTMVAIHA
jgi:hypothetical protein